MARSSAVAVGARVLTASAHDELYQKAPLSAAALASSGSWAAVRDSTLELTLAGALGVRVGFALTIQAAAPGAKPHDTAVCEDAVSSVAYSPDGREVATGDSERRLALWDRATGKQLRAMECAPSGSVGRCFSARRRTRAFAKMAARGTPAREPAMVGEARGHGGAARLGGGGRPRCGATDFAWVLLYKP